MIALVVAVVFGACAFLVLRWLREHGPDDWTPRQAGTDDAGD